MRFVRDDGGRAAAGYHGESGDCACRAIAIAAGIPYEDAYRLINQMANGERQGKRKRGVSSARTGVYRPTMHKVMTALGAKWTPTMGIGTGCRVHLRAGELPGGKIICSCSKHYVAVVDGVVHDSNDPSRDGTRCVYGYWTLPL